MLHSAQVQGNKSEQQSAELVGMKASQPVCHQIPVQRYPLQHHGHIANLLQPDAIRQEVTLDVQNQANEIPFLIVRLHGSAPLLKPSVVRRMIQILPTAVKLHHQLVLLFQHHLILIFPKQVPAFLCQDSFQSVPSLCDDDIHIPQASVQRLRIPGCNRCTLEYRCRYASLRQLSYPCLATLGNVAVCLFQKEEMSHPLVP